MTNLAARSAVLPTYARQDVTFVSGEGAELVGDDGKRYLDFVAGIAVVALGHCHPAPLAAAQAQLERLWHTSNLYWTEPMQSLAGKLSDRFGGGQAFFCNSGAEAIEAALKWARKSTGRTGLVSLEGSFHGRTLGSLSVTGQPPKRAAFEPLIPDVSFAVLNDADSLAAACGPDTAAILIEPIQGEGGIHTASEEFLRAAREIADTTGALLVFDEIQTGVGRTGSFFAFEQLGVRPDAVTLAKALANGLPIGCFLVSDSAPPGLVAGDHASTFGGNLVVCAAACAVCDAIDDELLAHVRETSARLAHGLEEIPAVTEVRGRGLLLAAEIDRPSAVAITAALDEGLLVGYAGDTALRLTPPLTIDATQVDAALELLGRALA